MSSSSVAATVAPTLAERDVRSREEPRRQIHDVLHALRSQPTILHPVGSGALEETTVEDNLVFRIPDRDDDGDVMVRHRRERLTH